MQTALKKNPPSQRCGGHKIHPELQQNFQGIMLMILSRQKVSKSCDLGGLVDGVDMPKGATLPLLADRLRLQDRQDHKTCPSLSLTEAEKCVGSGHPQVVAAGVPSNSISNHVWRA